MYKDPTTGEPRLGLQKVAYSHDAMIDVLIANPRITQGELASMFGYTQGWVSQIINSDAFKARVEVRKSELVDPLIIQSVDERLRAVAQRSLDVVLEKLDTATPAFALATAKFSAEALGYGARPAAGQASGPSVAVVVNVPGPAPSAAEWAAAHRPPTPVEVVEVVEAAPVGPPPVDHETAQTYP